MSNVTAHKKKPLAGMKLESRTFELIAINSIPFKRPLFHVLHCEAWETSGEQKKQQYKNE